MLVYVRLERKNFRQWTTLDGMEWESHLSIYLSIYLAIYFCFGWCYFQVRKASLTWVVLFSVVAW